MNNVVLGKMLSKMGIYTKECSNGLEAVEEVKVNFDNYSMIMMDINMPIMDGIESTRLIKQWLSSGSYTDIPIIALSAQDDKCIISRASEAGVSEYFVKPISFNKLMQVLKKYQILS